MEVERRKAIPDALVDNPHALALWTHFKSDPRASLEAAATATQTPMPEAGQLEHWLVLEGLLVIVRSGNGQEVYEQRFATNPPRDKPERRAIFQSNVLFHGYSSTDYQHGSDSDPS